jgi:hypothetical protein
LSDIFNCGNFFVDLDTITGQLEQRKTIGLQYSTSGGSGGILCESSAIVPLVWYRIKDFITLWCSIWKLHVIVTKKALMTSLSQILRVEKPNVLKPNRMGCTDEIPNIRDHGKMPKSPQGYLPTWGLTINVILHAHLKMVYYLLSKVSRNVI